MLEPIRRIILILLPAMLGVSLLLLFLRGSESLVFQTLLVGCFLIACAAAAIFRNVAGGRNYDIAKLVEEINLFRQGEFDSIVDVTEESAFKELSNALNALAVKLSEDKANCEQNMNKLKELNENTKKANQLLEEKVDHRTEDLRRALDDARASISAKSQFMASLSHEIRTPMNGVLGMQELLLKTKLDEKQHHLLSTAHKSAKVLLKLLNDVLDFSKIEAGKLTLESICFDLAATVGEVVDLFAFNAKNKGVRMFFSIPSDIPTGLRGDPGRLRQIISNLLGNALKFTEKGEISVQVGVVEETEKSVCLRFSVADTGIGVKAEVLERIFDSFAQGDGSTTRMFGGTGLGLAISRQLVDLMEGEMGVQTELGKGSTFWFTAYLEKQSMDEMNEFSLRSKDKMESVAHGEATFDCPGSHSRPALKNQFDQDSAPEETFKSFSSLSGIRILLVEDNPVNQEVAKGMLESIGINVSLAENGREGVEKFFAQTFDVVLMDCMMPVMDGYEATRVIRRKELEKGSHVLIIAVTGNALDGDREECINAGMDDYLAKPFNLEELLTIINRRLQKTKRSELDSGDAENEKEGTFQKTKNCGLHINPMALQLIRSVSQNSETSLVHKVVDSYLTHSIRFLSDLEQALDQIDAEAVRQAAHGLKTSSANVGAEILTSLCKELESMGRENSLDGAANLFAAIESESKVVNAALGDMA